MEENRVNVLCMKWGTKYPAKYVNVLYAMVKRNLTRPFRFVCLTDDPNGLVSQINHYPLPELNTKLSGPERGWNKLGVFSKKLYDLKGQVLCLDLDLIITGPLDDFFDYFGDVVIIRDWLKHDGTGNSSVYRFEIGSHPDIVSEFEDKSLLIVDDDNPFRERLARAMEKKGFDVESFSNYKSSVKRVKEKKFNFAIVDMRLGDGSGLELIKLISKISEIIPGTKPPL